MNKRVHLAGLLILMLMILTSCGPEHYASKYDVGLEHEEWANEIGLFSHENLKVREYEDENAGIKLELEYENGLAGYKELCDVVNAHNKFVEENPDYFPSDINVTFTNKYASEFSPSFFSNISNGSNGIDYISKLGKEDTAKVQYMYIDIASATTEIQKSDDIVIDVPAIILGNDYRNIPNENAYSFLSECKSAEQVIIDFHNVEYDRGEVSNCIRKYLPNAEIYSVEFNSGENHLEKCP
ncbi:hypothetical protein D6856_13910 [Butyrivibrio sp. XB500-5]|uniref:hypothetical protein n=1 Tax=Butyrivibrio sp. XB500-5 TaxID=2364880 RepID=UPI000EAA4663|nr:hypothetical protein [Butyrivibrio sp. XB500-5]RKM57746.1 hypothetical protein D6856_13910 [Butyrivibrio sp. XB500-5]